jgi:hypothetical protein
MNDQVISDNFQRIQKLILNIDERLDILTTEVILLKRRFNVHQHPLMKVAALPDGTTVALTDTPVKE